MDRPPDAPAESVADSLHARYRDLAAYLAGVIASLAEDARGWGFGVDHLQTEAQYRWLEEVRELQRERTALEDLIVARARAALPYRALPDERDTPGGAQ